ncbi:hypothetical protein H5410_029290 [Solanum commersonii]|uniref:Uncharacterized protein n=1 Tax=Solanum commersonii TaxID=4109 RepID=A0A9J5ZA39_SOLCO|nr:hypothetical protein H5410_029290 [Solanum commersonii]
MYLKILKYKHKLNAKILANNGPHVKKQRTCIAYPRSVEVTWNNDREYCALNCEYDWHGEKEKFFTKIVIAYMVTVKGNVQPDAVSKTGKPTSFWEAGESAQTEAVSTA